MEVEPDVSVGGRLYPAGNNTPAILYFHGNGEIAADYHEIARAYTQLGILLFVGMEQYFGAINQFISEQ